MGNIELHSPRKKNGAGASKSDWPPENWVYTLTCRTATQRISWCRPPGYFHKTDLHHCMNHIFKLPSLNRNFLMFDSMILLTISTRLFSVSDQQIICSSANHRRFPMSVTSFFWDTCCQSSTRTSSDISCDAKKRHTENVSRCTKLTITVENIQT